MGAKIFSLRLGVSNHKHLVRKSRQVWFDSYFVCVYKKTLSQVWKSGVIYTLKNDQNDKSERTVGHLGKTGSFL